MAFATIDVTKGITGTISTANLPTIPVTKGGTGLTSGTTDQFLKFTGTTTVASSAVSAGITEYDQWRITGNTQLVGNATTILTSNFERNDTDFVKVGTGMSESSGIFTFATTGIYQIIFDAFYRADGGARPMIGAVIATTTDNGTYSSRAFSYTSGYTGDAYASATAILAFDVTNTTTHKVQFRARHGDTTLIQGSTYNNYTCFTFTRIGDT